MEIERKVPEKNEVFFALHKKNEVRRKKKFAKFAFTWLGFRLITGKNGENFQSI